MFMHAASTAPATADQARDSAPADPRRGRLLGLVRKLIDYGRELAASLHGSGTSTPPPRVAYRFATLNIALIINRITRGLMIAAALERRLLRPGPLVTGQAERKAPPTGSGLERAGRRPRPPRPDEQDELLGALPSAREIAARVRNRNPGTVIAEICRDLGITGQHPLWRDALDAITVFGGNRMAILRVIWQRSAKAEQLGLSPPEDPRCDPGMAALTHPS